MEITLARSTLTEVADRDVPFLQREGFLSQLQSIGTPSSLRKLRRERAADGLVVEFVASVVDGHLASLPEVVTVTEELVGKFLQGESTAHQDTGLTVLSPDCVGGLQGDC